MPSDEPKLQCTKCGALNDTDQFYCSECRFNLHMVYSGPPVEQKNPSQFPAEEAVEELWKHGAAAENDARPVKKQGLENRYRDAYSLASILLRIGGFVKVVGIVLGGLLALSSLTSGIGVLVFGGLLIAVTVGLLVFVFGLLLSAQGQILRANLDSAVNSFPTLAESEKRRMMGL
jgi:hypothetical protein